MHCQDLRLQVGTLHRATLINQSTVHVCRLPGNLLFVVKHILLHSLDANYITICSARVVTLSKLLSPIRVYYSSWRRIVSRKKTMCSFNLGVLIFKSSSDKLTGTRLFT